MSLEAVTTIAEARDRVAEARRDGRAIGLVPTMGALHAGHGSLVRKAVQESDLAVVSIFVNPLQFGPKEDFQRYPRNLETDLACCRDWGAHLVFAPETAEMYPTVSLTTVEVARVSEGLCGAFRPGHFRGVATVVLKLFNIIQPDRAYFGEKDAQQLAVIRRMTADLNLNLAIVPVPTVREPDGLAMSSRNRYLNAEERQTAPVLYRALCLAQQRISEGVESAVAVKEEAVSILRSQPLIRVEYFEIVDANDMQPVANILMPVVALAAIWIGSTRLIDNLRCYG
jgi:pantoate--beta-alanine ligase